MSGTWHVHAGAGHLAVCDAQEVALSEFVVEHDEDSGARSQVRSASQCRLSRRATHLACLAC